MESTAQTQTKGGDLHLTPGPGRSGLGWVGLGEGGGIKHIKFIKELRCISWQRDASSTSPSSGAPGESPRRSSRLGEGGGGWGGGCGGGWGGGSNVKHKLKRFVV